MLIHKHFSKITLWAILTVAAILMTPIGALAQASDFVSPASSGDFEEILRGIANFIGKKFGIPVVAFFLILSGFMFVAAQGNKEKLKTARTMLLWTLVGSAIVIGAKPIAEMVINLAKQFGAP